MPTSLPLSASSAGTALFESASASPMPTPTGQPDNMQRGANYFFGFLITFIVLLLIFVGCGVGTRRRFLTRRGMMAEWAAEDAAQPPQKEPVFIEPWIGAGGHTWATMTPLSATAKWPSSKSSMPTSAQPTPTSPPTSRLRQILHHAPWRLRSLHKPRETSKERSPSKPDSPSSPVSVQVTVMIAMPSQNQPESEKPRSEEEDRIPEYSFGVTQVDWRGKNWLPST